jgi:pimeloyl-ACP methyl ester carboxylesterase
MPDLSRARRATRLTRVALGVVCGLCLAAFALWLFQARLIYFARPYEASRLAALPSGLVALRDPADATSVVGFYRPPSSGHAPKTLWLVFGGNGDQALNWDTHFAASADVGFLLVEYPGYGARTGQPSPDSILEGAEVTLQALAKHLGLNEAVLRSRSSVLGYSIGGAAALAYAAKHPVQRIVLLAPFTSMLDMARRVVGTPLCHLLTHRFDNVQSLRVIRAKSSPELHVLHGDRDTLIPAEMGRAVASAMPGGRFELVSNADHVTVVDSSAPRLRELLAAR